MSRCAAINCGEQQRRGSARPSASGCSASRSRSAGCAGSSPGREGPTVQICSGVAKGMGKIGGVSPQNLKLLLPVGAAAGIAAAFNAPIAAVTFTIEEIVGTLDQTLLSGVIVAAALAAVVERSILGENP